MAIKVWKPEFSNSNEVAPEQPSNLRVEESKNTQETWKPSLDLPSQNDKINKAFGGESKPQMSDYDLFKSIHYTPEKYGRTNYVKGEEEEMWNKLGEHFDLPKYESNKYSFLVNDKDKSVRLSTRGVSDGLGFGGWKEKPQDLGQLKRKQDASSIDFSKENDPAKLVSFIEKNMGNNDAIDSFNDAMERLEKLVPFTDEEYDILAGGTGEQIMEVLNSKIKENENTRKQEGQNLDKWLNDPHDYERSFGPLRVDNETDSNKLKRLLDFAKKYELDDSYNNIAERIDELEGKNANNLQLPEAQEITKDKVLSDYLKASVKPSEYDENVFETENGEEYLVVDEDKARQYAEDDIQATIDDLGLQAFSRNFQDWIINNAIDSNWLEQIKEEEADYFENEGDEETAERYRNMSDDELIDELKGMYGEKDFASFVGENIDWDKVIDEAISWDGIAHFIARYDGKEIELPNGLYAYRIN